MNHTIKRVIGLSVSGTVIAALLVAGGAAFTVQAANAATFSAAEAKTQIKAERNLDTIVASELTKATTAQASAQQALAASKGQTLDENARTELQNTINASATRIAAAQKFLAESKAAVQTGNTATITALTSVASAPTFTTPTADVTAAVTAYKVKQAAIAAAKAAAIAAAKLAAEGDIINVWTASGFQASIDACRGAVDVTAQYGVHTIAEHWTCGGSSFPRTPGSIVTLTGIDAGTYRVDGVVAILSAYKNSPADIPRGYDLIYQSCLNNSAATEFFAGLTKIG